MKGAKQKINPSDFIFAQTTDKNLRVRIPVTFGGAYKNWNVPYGLPLFKAVFTKAQYTNKGMIKENRGLKLIKKEENVPVAGGTQPLGDSSICFNLSGLITNVTLLVVCVDFLRWLAV